MNRRSFFSTFAKATAGAVATLAIDPEQLLWVPGKKTIVDLGAVKPIVPATDVEMVQQATQVFIGGQRGGGKEARLQDVYRAQRQLERSLIGGMRLELFDGGGKTATFFFDHNDNLVGKYSAQDMELYNRPLLRGKPTRYGQ